VRKKSKSGGPEQTISRKYLEGLAKLTFLTLKPAKTPQKEGFSAEFRRK
jgi:hypothetical protein